MFLTLLLLSTPCVLNAERSFTEEPPVSPLSPESMAQGGSFLAVSKGYNALFTNPAGFAAEGPSFTLISFNPWIYADPLRYFGSLLLSEDSFKAVYKEATDGGYGIGFASGLGYVGNGLGLGMVFLVDSYLYGQNLGDIEGDSCATLALIGGYALSFNFLGIGIDLGFSLRPMVRVRTPLPVGTSVDLMQAFAGNMNIFEALNNADAYHGVGMGIDLGLLGTLGPFKAGITIKDLGGTPIVYQMNSFGSVMSSFAQTLLFPKGSEVSDQHLIPMVISLGLGFRTEFSKGDPLSALSLHGELRDVSRLIDKQKDIWTALHLGAEFEFWDAIALRCGINQGYFTFGGGFKFPAINLSFAFFSRELGDTFGEQTSSGVSMEFAVRF